MTQKVAHLGSESGRGLDLSPLAKHARAGIKLRFLAKTTTAKNDCWEWCGAVIASGYGQMGIGMAVHYAHRISHALFIGSIPPGSVVMHACDNRSCVNPRHLVLGTQRDNMIDAGSKGKMSRKRKPSQQRTGK